MCVYDKTFYPNANESDFKKACQKLEFQIPQLVKEKHIQDVDGSDLQYYYLDNNKIIMFNDYEVDAIYLESEIDLTEYLEKD